jgi:hypothetical protein
MSLGEPLSELVSRVFNRRTPRDLAPRGIDIEPERKGRNHGFAGQHTID